jgi:hypothetical protein
MENPNLIPRSLWKAGNNQHRLVFLIRDGKVYYGSRGGNVMNEFTQGEKCAINAFLENAEYIRLFNDHEWDQGRKDLSGWIISNRL